MGRLFYDAESPETANTALHPGATHVLGDTAIVELGQEFDHVFARGVIGVVGREATPV